MYYKNQFKKNVLKNDETNARIMKTKVTKSS